MKIKFASPFEIGVYIGLINLILFIIFAILDHYFIGLNNYFNFFNNFNGNKILTILGLMVTHLYICCFIIDKNNTPCHIFIVFAFGQLAYYSKDIKISLVVVIICLIIILFFSLVFNEIIEHDFCGLSRNTRRNMAHRAKNEVDESEIMKNQTLQGNDELSENSIDENLIELNPILN
jgi:hypothetical protein